MSRAIAGYHATVFAESVTGSFAERACSSCERAYIASNDRESALVDELATVTAERESLFDMLDNIDRQVGIPYDLCDTPGFKVYELLFRGADGLRKIREELADEINREAGANAVIGNAVETAVKGAVGAGA
jgi:hypothetical protein